MNKVNQNIKNICFLISVLFACGMFLRGEVAFGAYNYENISFYTQITPNSYVAEGTAFYARDNQIANSLPIYRLVNSKGNHFYTISESEKNLIIANDHSWSYEGIAYYAYASEVSGTSPVYRFYNPTKGVHFYTISEGEKNILINNPQWGYNYENVAYYTYTSEVSGTSPVYRFLNPQQGNHFYTISESEKDLLSSVPVFRFYNPVKGAHFYTISVEEKNSLINSEFLYEGIAFFAQISQISGTSPVYRFFNASKGVHFYTISESEKNLIIANDHSWSYEGIAYYAYASEVSGTSPVYRFYNPTKGVHFYTISEGEKNALIKSYLGPEIAVGLWSYTKTGIQDSSFKISANKKYNIKDSNGDIISQIDGDIETKVTYDEDSNLEAYGSISNTLSKKVFYFDAADGDNTTLIFDVNRPNSSNDNYRGKVKIQYTDKDNIWIINTLPLEHYVWGMGEMTGTGPEEHSKVMTTIFRTYGMWYIQYATKYLPYGFKIKSDSGSQIYRGYDWETNYPNIKAVAQKTRGNVAYYGDEVALTPYSSWSDGRTRSFEERWGSKEYPWCKSVSDPYGKNSNMTTAELEAAGNHMVGLVANGSLKLAGDDYEWSWDRILKYYFTNINLLESY